MLADSVEDNNHLFICGKRMTHLSRRSIINQIKILRKTVDENLYVTYCRRGSWPTFWESA